MMPQVLSPPTTNHHGALQWWHQRQLERQHQSAERIRDGLLQDLFAIRRSLEVTQEHAQSIPDPHLAQVRSQLDSLHWDLELISNHLSPPFAHDDLNLAVQYLLQQWQQQHPTIELVSSLDLDRHGTVPHHHLALMSLTEWLDILSPVLSEAARLNITLQTVEAVPPRGQDPPTSNVILTLGVYEPNLQQRDAIAQHTSLAYLCDAFRILSGGQVTDNIHQETSWIQWQFCWSLTLDDLSL